MATIPARLASEADFRLKLGAQEIEGLRVSAFHGHEGISELFEFRVELCSDDPTIDAAAQVGQPAALEIASSSGVRYVNGIVKRFERTGEGSSLTYYAAEIVPAYWLLTRRRQSRLFLDQSVPDIIKKVLTDAGITEQLYRLALQGSYSPREFVVQYRESDMDFISRLMEDEGIFYFFEHAADGHKMVLGDGTTAHVPLADLAEFPYRDPNGLVAESEFVFKLRDGHEIQISSASLDDFDFKHPALDLRAIHTGSGQAGLHAGDYPGDYVVKDDGPRRAKIRYEEQQCRKRVVELATTVRTLAPGFKFTLADHPSAALNIEYLVTHVTHLARQPASASEEAGEVGTRYETDARVIPAEVSFRPPRLTPRPTVLGSQTALVVGPSGEEIYTDEYGRVKVQFHWDEEGAFNENSSCWIRVSQGSAGGQYGMMFLPRIGQEVIVDFLEGNPDRPIITGRVYNADQMPPYTLPDEKTKSTIKTNSSTGGGGTNEITFEDKKGSEQILIFAQKDLHVRATNDSVTNVDHNQHITVKEHSFELVKQKKHSEIKLDLNEKIGGKHSHETTGDYGLKVGGNHSNETAQNLYLKGGQNVVIEAGAALTLKVGGNFVVIDSSGVSVQGTLTKINSGGAAGAGSPVALNAPEATIEAGTATPGADKTYSATAQTAQAVSVQTASITPPGQETQEKVESWVEIEMVDEAGQPWKNEYYEVTRADGRVIKGYLNEQGQAHIYLPKAEAAKVSFPRLDAEAWEKL